MCLCLRFLMVNESDKRFTQNLSQQVLNIITAYTYGQIKVLSAFSMPCFWEQKLFLGNKRRFWCLRLGEHFDAAV